MKPRRRGREICLHLASGAEGCVERAIRIVPGDGEVLVRIIIVYIGCPDDDQFAISLHRHCVGDVGAMIKIGHHSAAALECRKAGGAECRIEVSVGCLRHLPTQEQGQYYWRGTNRSPVSGESVKF
jgi:hypothetical protein